MERNEGHLSYHLIIGYFRIYGNGNSHKIFWRRRKERSILDSEELRNLPLFERALVFSAMGHAGQKDKGGSPYILHVIRVMEGVDNLKEQVVALLHDLLEDTETCEEDLLQAGFDPETVDCIRLLTREENEEYMEYIRRLSVDETAIRVKLSDLRDNQDRARLKREPTPEDMERLKKYQRAEAYLQRVLPARK